jgi:glycine betaine/proline transport system permease protein
MTIADLATAFDGAVNAGLEAFVEWAGNSLDVLGNGLEAIFDGLLALLMLPPFWFFIMLVALAGWRLLGVWFATFAIAGLALCVVMGLWAETMQTLALVGAATVVALSIAIPVGILAGLVPRLGRVIETVLDFLQTIPPYLYLLPGIAIIGYGPATAISATTVIAMPPALRLTALGIRTTPRDFIELGLASGMTGAQALWKIRLPYASAAILAGVNQCVMLAFGMVVIAGIVGSGGLGQAVYEAVRTLDVGRSIDAGLAIVVLTILLDRMSQRIGTLGAGGRTWTM